MKKIISVLFFAVFFSVPILAQISVKTLVEISRAEDELRYDAVLENLLKSTDAKIRARAALAAGRIGNDVAIPELVSLLENDRDEKVKAMATFALGEIESSKAAGAILRGLENAQNSVPIRARLVEAAGKIAAANAKDESSKKLGEAVLDALEREEKLDAKQQSKEIIRHGLTAILRTRPTESDFVAAKFLTNLDARIRADAANTLTRIRAKNANEKLRAILMTDDDPIARANAARALGAAEDKDAFNILLEAAATDEDARVRVSAIRSVGNLKDTQAAEKLIERGEKLLAEYKNSKFANPVEKSELLEIATVLGNLLKDSDDKTAFAFLKKFRDLDKFKSPETETALAKISPNNYAENIVVPLTNSLSNEKQNINWRVISSVVQGVSELSNIEKNSEKLREHSLKFLNTILQNPAYEKSFEKAIPDVLQAYAKYKTKDLAAVLRKFNSHKDAVVRSTAVQLLGEFPAQEISFGDFEEAFRIALDDKNSNDALLAAIGAVGKQKTERAADFLKDRLFAMSKLKNHKFRSSTFLARRRIIALLKEKGAGDFSDKLGKTDSIFTQIDYVRAVSRKNGTVKAVLTTEKGNFTINFTPEDAPLTVENFVKLARANFFNGAAVHRVVPNFVMQDGDPRGDGNGGPAWSIRCEINMLEYERGAVGMALSGKDTGGSQWFATHSPQPHLDGGYTVFGRVNETDMKIVDSIVRGDKILSVRIIEGKK